MRSQRWISVESHTPWPSRVGLNSTELGIYGKYKIQLVNEFGYSCKLLICSDYNHEACAKSDTIAGTMQGWAIIRDRTHLVETARSMTTQLRWDARLIELDRSSDEKLLVCQKPYFRKQQ
ncbi:hypothetical protein GW17_00030151 [Ensete ventricosum]|uniref:Uncharacterized protein n=1 Tax=Ensete ventricosum TaxID=4639 RepID=A0A444E833_ENSVE|nr:hypothetical protein B296_00025033 [Ensete ventricosum]RWW06514.1 hypothetical protein GW17_00030151 [Ensete ventricosum]